MTLAQKYAKSIYEARQMVGQDDEQFYAAIVRALKKRRHEKLLPLILQEYAKLASREDKSRAVIRAATEKDEEAGFAEARRRGFANPLAQRDSTLIRGYRIETRNLRIDASSKRALVDLYARLIAH